MIQYNQLIVFKILCFTRVCQKWWIQSLVQWKPHSPGQISQSRTWADIFAFVLSCFINKQTNKQTNKNFPKWDLSWCFWTRSVMFPTNSLQPGIGSAMARIWLFSEIFNSEYWATETRVCLLRNKFSTQVSIFGAALHPAARCRRLLCHKCIYFKVGRNPLSETQGHKKLNNSTFFQSSIPILNY